MTAANIPEGTEKPTEPSIPAPYIYRIVVQGTTVRLIGGARKQNFQITLLEQPAPKKEKEQ